MLDLTGRLWYLCTTRPDSFSRVSLPLCIPTSNGELLQLVPTSSVVVLVSFLDFRHIKGVCSGISWFFSFVILQWKITFSIFSPVWFPFVYFLWWDVLSDHLLIFFIRLFVFLLFSFKSSLYILKIILYHMYLLQIFFPRKCLLIFLIMIFADYKTLILMTSSLSILFLMDCAFHVVSKMYCQGRGHLDFLLPYLLGIL